MKQTMRIFTLSVFYERNFAKLILVLVDRTPTHKTHLCSTVWSQRAPHTQCAWLKTKRDLQASLCPKNKCCHLVCHMSHPWLFSHAPSSMSTSSSSLTYPTTQREHSAHPAHLLEDENNKCFLQKTCWYSRAQSRRFWWLDHSGSQNSQWRKWIAKQSLLCRGGTRLGSTMDTITPVQKQKLHTKPREACKSSWNRRGNHKSLTLTIPWNLASLARNYPGIIERQHHTDQKQMGFPKEPYVEWIKGHLRCCYSPVWVTNGGRNPWNADAICETFRIFYLMGRHPMKGGSDYHFLDQ